MSGAETTFPQSFLSYNPTNANLTIFASYKLAVSTYLRILNLATDFIVSYFCLDTKVCEKSRLLPICFCLHTCLQLAINVLLVVFAKYFFCLLQKMAKKSPTYCVATHGSSLFSFPYYALYFPNSSNPLIIKIKVQTIFAPESFLSGQVWVAYPIACIPFTHYL